MTRRRKRKKILRTISRELKWQNALEQLKKLSTTIEIHQVRAKRAVAGLTEFKNNNKKAEDAAVALNEFKNKIHSILNADNEELKKRCTTIEIHQVRAERAEAGLAEFKNYKKKAKDAAVAFNEFKRKIHAILNADNEELKKKRAR